MIITWIPDSTGRFRQRPYFSLEGMDRHCERIVERHNRKLYGQPFPGLRTDALLRMLNEYADLHLYEDLSKYGAGVEAVTIFASGKKPTVRVARELYFDRSQNNHLRFVLAHELFHARFQGAAWRRRWIKDGDIFHCSPNKMLTLGCRLRLVGMAAELFGCIDTHAEEPGRVRGGSLFRRQSIDRHAQRLPRRPQPFTKGGRTIRGLL